MPADAAQSHTFSIAAIYRYPVKGLSAEPLERVPVDAGGTLPFDRAFAIENGPGRFDPAEPKHLPKINFLMLMRNEKLATLEAKFDDVSQVLTLSRAGRTVISGDLSTRVGRALVEQFLAAFMADDLRGAPRILSAPGHSFSDVAVKCLHVVNLATIRDLEQAIGRPVNPLRFRPNLVVDGLPAWKEFDLIGGTFEAEDVRLKVLKRTDRCAATNVDPETGERNMDIPAQLARKWAHTDFGVYAEIVSSGELRQGAAFKPVAA
jgi:hypothetical protein